MKTAIFLASGFEEMEAICPIDILRRADVETVIVSMSNEYEVAGAHNITIKADKLFGEMDFSECEMLILPGGMPGAANLAAHEGLRKLLLTFEKQKKRIAANCAAPSVVLGKMNLLKGKEAICYPNYESGMTGAQVSAQYAVTDEHITTAKGPGVAQEFGLELLKLLKGNAAAAQLKAELCMMR
jgi:4-methyl-5(b-hydroxyethyl)-thiazole monophosphate biosynthesis